VPLVSLIVVLIVTTSVGILASPSDSLGPAVPMRPPLTKSPTTAVLLSLAAPGLGQFYTESYWKIPIFAGAAVATAYLAISNHGDYVTADNNLTTALAQGESTFVTDRKRRSRDVFRQNRDVNGALLMATYLLAAIDAYVGAHLYDFDVDASLSLGLAPTPTAPMAIHMIVRW